MVDAASSVITEASQKIQLPAGQAMCRELNGPSCEFNYWPNPSPFCSSALSFSGCRLSMLCKTDRWQRWLISESHFADHLPSAFVSPKLPISQSRSTWRKSPTHHTVFSPPAIEAQAKMVGENRAPRCPHSSFGHLGNSAKTSNRSTTRPPPNHAPTPRNNRPAADGMPPMGLQSVQMILCLAGSARWPASQV